jgi:thymidylate synthase (FAD)
MRVEIIEHTSLKPCITAARTCYDSFKHASKVKDEALLKKIIASGHDSILEHWSCTFYVEGISRACSHQLVRHRHASYAQRSQRYVEEDNLKCVVPESISKYQTVRQVIDDCYTHYLLLLAAGAPKEDARYILPQGWETSLTVTMNARGLRHFFSLRCCEKSQWELRNLAEEMLRKCKIVAPVIFEGAGKQCGSCKEKCK